MRNRAWHKAFDRCRPCLLYTSGELSPFATQYADVISKNAGYSILITDRDHVIAAAGISRKEVLERRVSHQLEAIMEERQSYYQTSPDDKKVRPVEGLDRASSVAIPIISAGDVAGAVIMLEPENGKIPNEMDVKIIQVAAAFLGKQMEE